MSIVVVAVTVMSLLCVYFIRETEHRRSDQIMLLLCETGERNLDYYFNSIQKSVNNLSKYVASDIDGLDDEHFARHTNRVKNSFEETAIRTNGVLTYYYRIDPEVSNNVKGFWYTNLDGNGFVEHKITDITLYDTSDTSKLVWFTVPKHERKAIWLPPYITDNLDKRVISYNVPIFWHGNFVGVVGFEMDYSTMAEQVESIRLYNNGYAFLNDSEGNLFYHPYIDVSTLTEKTTLATPDGVVTDSTFFRYNFDGVEKDCVWMQLCNGMRLNVTAPVSETEGDWQNVVKNIIFSALCVLFVVVLFVMYFGQKISKPLRQLANAADQVDHGNYDYDLDYEGDDEIGKLTKTFKRLSEHMKDNIEKLNKQVFVDSLTHVKNKGAFTNFIDKLQKDIDNENGQVSFSIGVFDCDDLKFINDRFGHDKGDVYLETASRVICHTFKRSPVFRIGGDEFAVILSKDDYTEREELISQFEESCKRVNAENGNKWEQVHISMGFADYDPLGDSDVSDVVRRADKVMYKNKRQRKKAKNEPES